MFGVFKFVTYFLCGFLGFFFGNLETTAATQCPVPPNSSLIYLNLEKLNSLSFHQGYHNVVDTPLLCYKGHDEECREQKCCPKEVGCCLSTRTDDEKHVRECGCKEANSKQCTYPSPYAILATSECGNGGTTKITACLREKRVGGGEEYLPNQMGSKSTDKSYRQLNNNPLLTVVTDLVGKLDDLDNVK